MNALADQTLNFLVANTPTWGGILAGGPPSLLWSWLCLYGAGYLKRAQGWKTGYSRKVFHFLIFISAAVVQSLWGTPALCLFGGACSLVIFYAVARGPGNLLYEGIAREKDAPHRTYYIVVPYFATLIGGLAGNILFGSAAVCGYLVTGLGDAVGEPVGTRFGRHVYKAPSRASVAAVRSWEGSSAVFAVSTAAVALFLCLRPEGQFTLRSLMLAPLLGLVAAGVEAISPHGWDNAALQIIPAFLAWLLL